MTDGRPAVPARLVPRDAATLLLLDRGPSGLRVLMGRRRDDLAFNPGAYVFPGGRVDATDGHCRLAGDLSAALACRLLDRMRPRPSARRARALAVAALRETAEETGYLVGRPAEPGLLPHGAAFEPFRTAGIGLDLSRLVLVGRAITPPGRTRRFDARFLAAFAEDVLAAVPDGGTPPDRELSDVRFIRLEETGSLALPDITRVMLAELSDRLARDPRLDQDLPAPFYVPVRGGGHRRDLV